MCVTGSEHQIGGNRMGVPEVPPTAAKSDKSTKSCQKRSRRSRSSRQYWFGSGSSNLTNHYYQRGIVLLLLSTLQIIVQGRNPTTTDSSQFYTKEQRSCWDLLSLIRTKYRIYPARFQLLSFLLSVLELERMQGEVHS